MTGTLTADEVLELLRAGTHNAYSEPVVHAAMPGTVRINLHERSGIVPVADVTTQMLDLKARGVVRFNGLIWLPIEES